MSSKPRTVIVTGANKGIGYYILEALLAGSTPYNLILAARSKENAEKALSQLKTTYPNSTSTVTFKQLDIDDFKSIQEFVDWVRTDLGTYDVLVDNAAIGSSNPNATIIKTNFIKTVELTEKLLPYLAKDGKIIAISSALGSLIYQSKKARQLLEDPNSTTESLLDLSERLVKDYERLNGENELGFANTGYHASKVLLNAYVRWALPKKLSAEQQVFSVCPGWCRTDMGGENAFRSAEEGAATPAYLINLPFKVDQSINGKFLRDNQVQPWDWDNNVPDFLGVKVDY